MSDLKKFVNKYTSTASVCRVTTIEEFNKDAQYMVDLKEKYYDTLQRANETGDALLASQAQEQMSFMQEENKRLRLKHWPNS